MDIFNKLNLEFYCECQQTYLTRKEISDHLKIPVIHKILKRPLPTIQLKDFKNSILIRIDEIIKIQAEIQMNSIKLLKVISENTELAITRLGKLKRAYQNILERPVIDKNLTRKTIIYNSEMNESLVKALNKHFDHNFIAEKWAISEKIRNIKEKVLEIYNKNVGNTECAQLTSDENFIITGGSDGIIRVWNMKNNTQEYFMHKHKSIVVSIAIGTGNKVLLSGSEDCTVRFWDLNLRKQIFSFQGHEKTVWSVLISKDLKKGYSCSNDFSVIIWDLKSLEPKKFIKLRNQIYKICLFNNETTILAAGSQGFITFINLDNFNFIEIMIGLKCNPSVLKFNKDEKIFILGFFDGNVQIWLTDGFLKKLENKVHKDRVNQIDFSHDFKLFTTCSDDLTLKIWDVNKMITLHSFSYKSPVVGGIFLINSNSLFVSLLNSDIEFLKLNDYKTTKIINPENLNHNSITLSRELRYLAYGDKVVKLVNLHNLREISKSSVLTFRVLSMRFSQDTKILGLGDVVGNVIILDVPHLIMIIKLSLEISRIWCLTFSKQSNLIGYSDGKNDVSIKNIKNHQIVYKQEGVDVKDAVFGLNDTKFFYLEWKGVIHILNKNYTKINVISFNLNFDRIILSEDERKVLINRNGTKWSCLNIITMEKEFKNQSRSFVRTWSARRQDYKCLIHSSLRDINF